ncbi:hypothetical protein ACFL4W_04415 [Planctomycetota bacterium]
MNKSDRLQPWTENPCYWQYKGEPVLLLGGSVEDNVFQIPDIEEHLDLLHSVGGNYLRCTMSSRDEGDVWPFEKDPDSGLYDLNKPGKEYWGRFESFAKLCAERDIIFQIEMWDRFDFARDPWQDNPYNPKNNINYSVEESGLVEEINTHPGRCESAFFRSVPSREDNQVVLPFQQAQVDKLLSITLAYGNILYCMNNETSEPHSWGQYWIQYIQDKAAEQDALVFCTDMFDDGFKGPDSKAYPEVFNNPDIYTFVDISQINSRNFHEVHWERAMWMLKQIKAHPRPANNVKIYGSGHTFFGTGSPKDGVERFWRNIITGCASVRFHRPDSGNGLNERAQASIKAARLVESVVKFWDLEIKMDLITDRPCEAYLAGTEETYVLYLADGGTVELDLPADRHIVKWIDISKGEYGPDASLEGGTVTAPDAGDWIALIAP